MRGVFQLTTRRVQVLDNHVLPQTLTHITTRTIPNPAPQGPKDPITR